MTTNGCLSHIRVLDMSRLFAGPAAGQWLADFGADVIKIEEPTRGDDSRRMPPFLKDENGRDTESSAFISFNRGKRSVTVDFTKDAGRAIVLRLAAHSDVLIENFKVGTLKRHGLDYHAVRSINPGIVYCSVTGYGQTGPYAPRPGYDMIFQAMSGLMSITGVPDGEPGAGPMRVGYSTVDVATGAIAAIVIQAALIHRDSAGAKVGQHIDLALLDSQIASLAHIAMIYLVAHEIPKRFGTVSAIGCPAQPFDCADQPIVVNVGNDGQWARLCEALGRPALAADPRFHTNPLRVAHRHELIELIAPIFRSRKAADWFAVLENAGVPCGPVYDLAQVFEDPQVKEREILHHLPHRVLGAVPTIANPIKLSATPVSYLRPPPLHGEHTREVLHDVLGLADEEIEALARDHVIRIP